MNCDIHDYEGIYCEKCGGYLESRCSDCGRDWLPDYESGKTVRWCDCPKEMYPKSKQEEDNKSTLLLDYEIHMKEYTTDALFDKCAVSHFDGCECTASSLKQLRDLKASYKAESGQKWYAKVDLEPRGMMERLQAWYAKHETQHLGADELMPASEVY